ncbi:unnamed protein product [Hapterophycus canaliculatus]
MFDDVWFVFKDYVVWIKRRTTLLVYTSASSCMIPFMLSKAMIDQRRGEGWFSDPRGKPRLTRYGKELLDFTLSMVFLRSKPATESAVEAAKSVTVASSGDGITVKITDDYLEFQPKEGGDGGQVGVIIVPGALVSPFAYSILARSLAQRGYPSFVVRLPFDLALYGWTTPGKIIKRPQSDDAPKAPTKWVLAGHSLGTLAVELFTEARPECVNGVVYMATSRPTGKLSKLDLPSLLIRGSRDPFTLEKDMQKAADKLPQGTETCIVEGGNHRGFASYTHQPLDWEATITPDEQLRIVVEALTEFIERKVA